jgi:hypothetical protein
MMAFASARDFALGVAHRFFPVAGLTLVSLAYLSAVGIAWPLVCLHSLTPNPWCQSHVTMLAMFLAGIAALVLSFECVLVEIRQADRVRWPRQ